QVDPRVLVPRPETEVVVERCLALIRGIERPHVLDVGVGSGAIALAIADEHPGADVVAFDNSRDALLVARANAEAAGLLDRVRLVEHDLMRGLGPAQYDLVVSNPPYVDPGEIDALAPEVRDWEPRRALVGSGVTERLADGAREALREGGWLVLEAADGRGPEIAELLERLGYRNVQVTRDLADRERVVEGQWHL
ncbi:MAG: peptide chain release factor N(5)-glutamine methyltransferase, partial [Actinomycetota bacterium]|nr:peptide chain release factor N(5)-glutamine methyltransferase [Actinomycetota bacterium]